jgi:hypothetical protein
MSPIAQKELRKSGGIAEFLFSFFPANRWTEGRALRGRVIKGATRQDYLEGDVARVGRQIPI